MIRSILIANRGEIAVRIIKTAKKLKIKSIAVYSEADKNALHVQSADTAYPLAGNQSHDTYLNQSAIIAIAKQSHADAIHPGYGFLAENAEFQALCQKNNLLFIGPSHKAIAIMADKASAIAHVKNIGVPCIPGHHAETQTPEDLAHIAEKIGFPLLIKAAKGGGGKGMRLCDDINTFYLQYTLCQQEALRSFGDNSLIIEKYLHNARHVEVQIFGDAHKNIVHLFDRDCSWQRRHQKIIEIAPAPDLSQELRQKMASAAIKIAKSIDYIGAGTVEFLVPDDHTFYFIEMNTRLQVEHPVTEMITGIDLVAWQIEVANGRPLALTQPNITHRGSAIEARIYAEDPDNAFQPTAGTITALVWPDKKALRIDTGIAEESHVPPYYDPLLAKVICHESTPIKAASALNIALQSTLVAGITTNTPHLTSVLDAIKKNGKFNTDLITSTSKKNECFLPAIIAATIISTKKEMGDDATLFRISKMIALYKTLWHDQQRIDVSVINDENKYSIVMDDMTHQALFIQCNHHQLIFTLNEQRFTATVKKKNGRIYVAINGQVYAFMQRNPTRATASAASDADYKSPMTATVIAVSAAANQLVSTGDQLVLIEAMKMQQWVTANTSGTVTAIHCQEGDVVEQDQVLIEIDPV